MRETDGSQCQKPGCNKTCISFSDYCGEHTNNRELSRHIKGFFDPVFEALTLDEVEIKKLRFVGRSFARSSMTNIDFFKTTFSHCSFGATMFGTASFDECIFVDCTFDQVEFTDTAFSGSRMKDCLFEDCNFSECHIGEQTVISETQFDNCIFNGGMFFQTGQNANVKFLGASFTQVSFTQAEFVSSQFTESQFTKTSLYDSIFRECLFGTISNDFKITGIPLLCDFRKTSFENTPLPRKVKKWNNFSKAPLRFALSLTDRLLEDNHPNNLPELENLLIRLSEMKYPPNPALNARIKNLLQRLITQAMNSHDYRTVGEIVKAYGEIPDEYKSGSGFQLAPPIAISGNSNRENGRLKITLGIEQWQLAAVSRLMGKLVDFEHVLPQATPQLIAAIERGSLVIEIVGKLSQLIVGFRTIVEGSLATMVIRVRGISYNSKESGIEPAARDQLLEADIKRKNIEVSLAKATVLNDALAALEKLMKLTNSTYEEVKTTAEGKIALAIIQEIDLEHHIKHVEINDEAVNE